MKRPSLKVIENRFAALEKQCCELVKEKIGQWCKEYNATFSYGMDVMWQVYIEEDQVDEDSRLKSDPLVECHKDSFGWFYDVEPDEELMNVLTSYESMFVNWYQSDCIKGEWRGI